MSDDKRRALDYEFEFQTACRTVILEFINTALSAAMSGKKSVKIGMPKLQSTYKTKDMHIRALIRVMANETGCTVARRTSYLIFSWE